MHREQPEALRFLWGGHNLQTRFSHFGVREGDAVYPILIDRAYVYHSCANEVLIGTHGSFLHFDLIVARDILERWRYKSKRGERRIKGLVDGDLTCPDTFCGTYRVSDETSTDLFNLLLDHEAQKQLHRLGSST